jgi:hypothetical protein
MRPFGRVFGWPEREAGRSGWLRRYLAVPSLHLQTTLRLVSALFSPARRLHKSTLDGTNTTDSRSTPSGKRVVRL